MARRYSTRYRPKTRRQILRKVRRYPLVTSTKMIGFFRRLKTLPTIGQIERVLIEEVLRRTDWNKTRAAKALDITREGLRKKLFRMGLG